MNLKSKILLLLLIGIPLFVFQNNIVKAGFGISPPSVINKNLVPGSYYEQDIFLVQSQPDVDLSATITINADKIKNWIKIENGNTFVIPKGNQQFPMKVDVNIPSNAELGEYKGSITVSTSPVGAPKSGVSVVLGANVSIDLNVTGIQVSNFSIQNFQIPDASKGSPIKFIIKIKNDGNTDNGPTKVGLTYFDQYHSKQLGQQEEMVTDKVKSFQTGDISVEFPNTFDVGSYWADVKIYNSDKIAVDSKLVFNVIAGAPAQAKPKPFAISMPNLSAIPLWVYLLTFAVIIILILIIVIIVILRKSKK